MKLIRLSSAVLLVLFAFSCTGSDGNYMSDGYHYQSGKGGSMARFTISNDYLYTVDHGTLKTFDISIAKNPEYLKTKDQNLGFGIETIFSHDTLLYIGSQNGMYIYNITRPEFTQKMSMVSHIRSCDPVIASGKYAYVTLNSENTWCGNTSNILQIYDVSNPYSPLLIHTEGGFHHPRGLGIDNNKLFICDNGVKIYNISNPEKPIWVDDFSEISVVKNIDSYDVIPLNGLLLVTGANGLYQFDYKGDRVKFVSKIEIKKEKI